MNDTKVVITGYGIATSVAVGETDFKKSLLEQQWSRSVSSETITGVAERLYSPEICRRMDIHTKYGIVAAKLAMEHSGLRLDQADPCRIGGILGTVWGPIITTYNYFKEVIAKGPAHASPFLFPYTVTNAVTGAMARLLGLRGVSSMLAGCCPINYAYYLIKNGKADAILAGGIDNAALFFEIADDAQAGGYNHFDGSCVVVLETENSAIRRGATILAEIKACASGNILEFPPPGENRLRVEQQLRQIISQLDGAHRLGLENIGGVISMQDGCAIHETLANAEREVIAEVCRNRSGHPPLTRPYQALGNLWAPQSALNLCAALFALKSGAFFWEKPPRPITAHPPDADAKLWILSNSLFYGGGFHTLLISEYSNETF